MGSLKGRIRRAERAARAETTPLSCPECGHEFWVHENTDLEYIAYQWAQETGAKSHRPTPPDVLTLANHPHTVEGLINKATGEPWLQRLSTAGGHPSGNPGGNHDD